MKSHLSLTPDGRQGVKDLNLTIHPGETLALVGLSGAGKTTLINLLMGFLQAQRANCSAIHP